MLHKRFLPVLCILGALLVAACGGQGEGVGENRGSVSAGEKLFRQAAIGNQAGCITCHSLEPGVIVVGPSLSGIANTGASRIPSMQVEEYVRQSIVDPNAYVVEGFIAGTMPLVWAIELTEEQIDDLVSYLMTLE